METEKFIAINQQTNDLGQYFLISKQSSFKYVWFCLFKKVKVMTDGINKQVKKIESKIEQIEKNIKKIEGRVDLLEVSNKTICADRLNKLESNITNNGERLQKIEAAKILTQEDLQYEVRHMELLMISVIISCGIGFFIVMVVFCCLQKKFKKQIKNLDVKRELKSFEEEYKKKISNIGQAK